MARARIRSSATEELEIVQPSKLAIENVSKSFHTRTGTVQARVCHCGGSENSDRKQ